MGGMARRECVRATGVVWKVPEIASLRLSEGCVRDDPHLENGCLKYSSVQMAIA